MFHKRFVCIGHRGAGGHAPENTLAAVRRAVELGVDAVEVDVHAVEGTLVVLHDHRLERTTGARGYVAEQPLAQLRALDAGGGERIPLLAEVLDALPRGVGINVELKAAGTAERLADLLDGCFGRPGWDHRRVLVSSFIHPELRRLKSLDPRLQVGALVVGVPEGGARAAAEMDAFSLHASAAFLDQPMVEDAHRHGLRVFAFPVNDADELERMHRLGVDGVFTDYPELVNDRRPAGAA